MIKVKHPQLADVAYFVSNECMLRMTGRRKPPEGDNMARSHLRRKINDEEYRAAEAFRSWLGKNTSGRHYMGSNGVLCSIKEDRVYVSFDSPLFVEGEDHADLYLSVLRVRSTPQGRDLPEELYNALRHFNYDILPENKSVAALCVIKKLGG